MSPRVAHNPCIYIPTITGIKVVLLLLRGGDIEAVGNPMAAAPWLDWARAAAPDHPKYKTLEQLAAMPKPCVWKTHAPEQLKPWAENAGKTIVVARCGGVFGGLSLNKPIFSLFFCSIYPWAVPLSGIHTMRVCQCFTIAVIFLSSSGLLSYISP